MINTVETRYIFVIVYTNHYQSITPTETLIRCSNSFSNTDHKNRRWGDREQQDIHFLNYLYSKGKISFGRSEGESVPNSWKWDNESKCVKHSFKSVGSFLDEEIGLPVLCQTDVFRTTTRSMGWQVFPRNPRKRRLGFGTGLSMFVLNRKIYMEFFFYFKEVI